MGKIDRKRCRGCFQYVCKCTEKQGVKRTIEQKYPWKKAGPWSTNPDHKFDDKNKFHKKTDTKSRRKWLDSNNRKSGFRTNRLPFD
jgi:hypothetical protein|tara:strand:+ start:516 stop:773 length:258 start_codon:yes stop_codon:yes gene_type:complete